MINKQLLDVISSPKQVHMQPIPDLQPTNSYHYYNQVIYFNANTAHLNGILPFVRQHG